MSGSSCDTKVSRGRTGLNRCNATDRRWNTNKVSLSSPDRVLNYSYNKSYTARIKKNTTSIRNIKMAAVLLTFLSTGNNTSTNFCHYTRSRGGHAKIRFHNTTCMRLIYRQLCHTHYSTCYELLRCDTCCHDDRRVLPAQRHTRPRPAKPIRRDLGH